MNPATGASARVSVLHATRFDDLLTSLDASGYEVIGPTIRGDAIVYDEINSAADLPRGWGDRQEPGLYRLRRTDDDRFFGYALSPTSWKRFLFPPSVTVWQGRAALDGLNLEEPQRPPRYAFLGVRACELAGIAVQDRILIQTAHPDRDYVARREQVFLIAVNCGDPATTCFCTSMGTGPRANGAFDLALTEILDEAGHRFLVEIGSGRGAEVVGRLPVQAATPADQAASARVTTGAEERMGRTMNTEGIRGLLARNLEHPRWDEVADRCLSCGNCTMVCPTCFCVDFEDVGSLEPDRDEQQRVWTSCFSVDHSEIHGGSVRQTPRSRYRQWLTHKLGTWHDQFGISGCIGCGRCIAWCPVGIDITEEVAAIRAADGLTVIPLRTMP